jgi:hypothetical protein
VTFLNISFGDAADESAVFFRVRAALGAVATKKMQLVVEHTEIFTE